MMWCDVFEGLPALEIEIDVLYNIDSMTASYKYVKYL